MTTERRKSNRLPVERDYFILPGDCRNRHRCTVKNISVTGACISSITPLKKNDIIFLHITGPRDSLFKSEVVWSREGIYGILFHLEAATDFDNISYIMNNFAGSINAAER